MTISRGQMNRQLYMRGGIMDAMPRQEYGLGSFVKKAVKGVTKSVKKIASSDVGKAALIGAAAFGIPGTSIGGLLGRSSFMVPAGGAPGIFGLGGVSNLFTAAGAGASTVADGFKAGVGPDKGVFGKLLSGKVGKFAALAGVSTFLTGTLGMTEEQAEEELARDPSKYLELYYRNLNPPTADTNSEEYEAQVRDFVTTNTSEYAEGGRIGYQDAGPVLPNDPTQPVNPFAPKPTGPVLPDRMMASNEIPEIPEEFIEELKRRKIEDLLDQYYRFKEDYKRRKDMAPTQEAAMGGRIGYALGDTASQNAMQAAGIEGLPVRQNPKGVQELDLRDNGGFIPPVGIKEKEDDIPAMLSNNEFVFTADAVRGMGDGNVNVGAQRMYDMMKKLEAGGSV